MNILVINSGSSSIKYQIFQIPSMNLVAKGQIEKITSPQAYQSAFDEILQSSQQFTIDAIAHRVVHGGDQFRHACIINDDVIHAIRHWSGLAPLHNPHNLTGILSAQKAFPQSIHIAVFDTAFHANMPRRASTYAIKPNTDYRFPIKRFGFHGTSHQFVANKAAAHLNRPLKELRIISLHLGNGASACAIEFGHSSDTSMGMTPLEGLMMGTRCGDIDPGIIFLLATETNKSIEEIEYQLNNESGLKGLSGISQDIRDLEKAAAEGNDQARLAITVFAHRVRKYIGAYAAIMGGVDAIVLTGGIGENSASMRQRILQRLDFLGAILDDDKNLDARVSHDCPVATLHDSHSRVAILAIKTNEELQIAIESQQLLATQKQLDKPRNIPIAISARHIHLNESTFKQLFGESAVPTFFKDLSQPGQYACQEQLTLIGPKGRIEHVRLLGPLRKQNQIEISRTDEFLLGIDAPVRDSGHTTHSAPITLEGPSGKVHLKEGLICARRHIHMHPSDADYFNVNNNDIVEVAIHSEGRKLTFGDVLIRVDAGFVLEMHIDTDEANAAELNAKTDATLIYDTTPAIGKLHGIQHMAKITQ